ncbi:hypothetical protein GE061_001570 [Apolygus lucorum]|uniref:Retrotransposon gag domain-containing protein n=1 Tax=Apolygus lucorum TaxID=248454 RepID=A0A6A4K271_APOLU|nr:hypothetical protein GE061_001570 [Apolygus lucorum]
MDTRSTRRDRAPVPQDEGDTVDHADIVNQVGERVDENRTDSNVAPEGSNSTEVDVIVERVLEKMQELRQTQQESCMLGVRHMFELIAEHNGWNNFSKAAALSSVLSGTALEILTEVENPQSYLALTEALKKRFGIRHQAQRNLTLLCARVQQPKEDLQAYHQAIKSLARRAWPAEARRGANEDVVLFHFMRGIRDPGLRDKMMSTGARTMDEALDSALRLEAVCKLSLPVAPVRRGDIDCDEEISLPHERYPVARATDATRESPQQRRHWQQARSQNPNWRPQPRCWRCDTIGLVVAHCPHPPIKASACLALPEP